MEPYRTEPVIVERTWGGNGLRRYNKKLTTDYIGESWETGKLKGDTPILVKLIDAREALSVQVHPDDNLAAKTENAYNGKSEAWVILESKDTAFIVYGFKMPVTKDEFRYILGEGRLSQVLNYVKVKKGDCIYIPAGTIHSLGEGILAYEVQQPSDLTYRIYDWDRTDAEGNKRELHLDKAIEAINYSPEPPCIANIYDSSEEDFFNIIECKYFQSSFGRLERRKCHSCQGGKYMVLTVTKGSILLEHAGTQIQAGKGDTCIIPKECEGIINIECLETAEYIVSTPKL